METTQPQAPELTPRQEQILAMLAEGQSNRDIAGVLGVTTSAVANYIYNLYGRIGVDNRVAAARWWLDNRAA